MDDSEIDCSDMMNEAVPKAHPFDLRTFFEDYKTASSIDRKLTVDYLVKRNESIKKRLPSKKAPPPNT
jgi:hypothetical protein